MSKTAFIRARIEPTLKGRVQDVFDKIGVTPTQVITMLYKIIEREKRIPFSLHIPNDETTQAIQEVRKGKDLIVCKDMQDLFEQLDI